ncbi:hypothetical protein CGGC5_v007046 [Colletotrichum fructicola Nara gc5]|uniref:Uncharacterized protein n=1 Tax=Colletotrichum fructicola (strain Nara gc5) TaxID=1213859 RepID=A0A7J6J418_COLFN|nr:hypothetical protein CGGC5_v007046 [Colletotrichum fructicola Nara gc5]
MRIDPQQQYAPTLLVSSAFPVSPHEKSRETHEGPLPTRSAVVSPSIGPFYETPRPPPTLVIAFLLPTFLVAKQEFCASVAGILPVQKLLLAHVPSLDFLSIHILILKPHLVLGRSLLCPNRMN